jgi:hypothetical protein
MAIVGGELLITQMQGINAKRPDETAVKARGLAPFNWRKVLVDIAKQMAVQNGLSGLAIQSAANNKWAGSDYSGARFTMDRARQVYDEFARSIKYIEGTDGNFHEPTGPTE